MSIQPWINAFPDPLQLSCSLYPLSHSRYIHGHHRCGCGPPGLDSRFSLHQNTLNSGRISFAPFHGLVSPTLRSLFFLYPSAPLSEASNLICSFPSLHKVVVMAGASIEPDDGWVVAPSTSLKLAGELHLSAAGETRFFIRRLLDLPGDLHLTRIYLQYYDEDADATARLVSRCSGGSKDLTINYNI